MQRVEACIAAHRLGLGPKPGDLGRISRDPRGWALAQIKAPVQTPESLTVFPSSRERLRQIISLEGPGNETGQRAALIAREVGNPEIVAQYQHRLVTDTPLVERMVAFWCNHFAVARNKSHNRAIASSYATEAIRPHVFGRFADLLFAAETHPAMAMYLDNAISVGPNSLVGQRRQKLDINENLAREILELHTLGVDGGYSQEDVEQLALILTGWSFTRREFGKIAQQLAERRGVTLSEEFGPATFIEPLHEPGSKTLLGKTYSEDGPGEFRAVAEDLARHPSTATFIATKLVRHFVADEPPVRDVERVAGVFRETDGDLAAVTSAVVELDTLWSTPLTKAKTPQDFVVASLRAIDHDKMTVQTLNGALAPMGQQPLMFPSPQGWPDTADKWLSPGTLMRRIEYSHQLSRRINNRVKPDLLLEWTIGPVASRETRALVAGAPSGVDAVAYVFASREFQRR